MHRKARSDVSYRASWVPRLQCVRNSSLAARKGRQHRSVLGNHRRCYPERQPPLGCLLSRMRVTGPTLTRLTFMSLPKTQSVAPITAGQCGNHQRHARKHGTGQAPENGKRSDAAPSERTRTKGPEERESPLAHRVHTGENAGTSIASIPFTASTLYCCRSRSDRP